MKSNSLISLTWLGLLVSSQVMAANSSDHYLSKAYGRFMDDMLGYSRNPDGSINWTARAARFSSGAMKAKRPGSGLDTNRSCIYGDYDYWNYLLDKYLLLTPEEKARFLVLNNELFYKQIGGSGGYAIWKNYSAQRSALITSLRLKKLDVPAGTSQEILKAQYLSGSKVINSDSGAAIDVPAGFEQFMKWNEKQTDEMGRFNFWKNVSLWAIPYGTEHIVSRSTGESSTLPEQNSLKLKLEYFITRPLFSKGATDGYPLPNGKFEIDKVNEIAPITTFHKNAVDKPMGEKYIGSAFMQDWEVKTEKFIKFTNNPGAYWGKYYVWARTQQTNAFFDWLMHRYDPKKYGCDDKKEICWSGRELFSNDDVPLPAACENTILKEKPIYASNPATYTFKFPANPDDVITTLVNCYCSD